MKITAIQTTEIRIPLRTPFKTALRTVDSVHDVLVRVQTDTGEAGYGEAPPTAVITGDTIGSIRNAIEEFIAPALVGMDVEDLDCVMTRLDRCILKNTSAKAAVDMAIYDLYAKSCGKPLYRVLGGAKKEIETDLTISVNPIPQMVADAHEAVNRGFNILKIKVGKEGLKDVARLRAIREAVGPGVVIRVDANQGWTREEAVSTITAMEEAGLNIELVEQPVSYHDFKGMQYVTSHVETPILADESVFSYEDAIRLMEEKGADLINIKLMKTGGIHEAVRICDAADQFGVKFMIGCMLESKVSVSAGVHLAAARSCVTMADLDGPSLCRLDPYEGGPVYKGPEIFLKEDCGIGITGVPVTFEPV